MASKYLCSPSSVTRACDPSGGYEVLEHWDCLRGRVFWEPSLGRPVQAGEMGQGSCSKEYGSLVH
ncbi:hypothetical protein DM860_007549 [Cuscuta australis]|uniref:Uncharacterized protein n=1 Tax=Cuscuta australis TaxID=267555 RepID=A0A328E8H5_9ASTE|nr:hypothetical protein DM860_007549 [Cuscuta australis]